MIKKNAPIYLFAFITITLCSCGENRTGEYQALIEEDEWIAETMRDIYLWNYDIPTDDKLNFFAAPEDFFPTLLSTKDKFSTIEIISNTTKSNASTSDYGFEFLLYSPANAPKNRVARIIFVSPHSAAAEAGLKRGDWISGVHGETLNQDNYGYLISGGEEEFTTATLEIQADNTYTWTNDKTIQIGASHSFEDNPFYIDTVYNIENAKIAYLMYNSFSTGPEDQPDDDEYNVQMRNIFTRFKGETIHDFILDLRYNPGGYLSCSQVLASLLAPENKLGETYCSLAFNQQNMDKDFSLPLNKELTGGANLNLSKLYVIVTNETASASEAVINCLRPYMEVILIGTTTTGKNVASEPSSSDKFPGFILHPMVAYVNNSKGEADYADGITPDYELDESSFMQPLNALGDTAELMLKNTIALIIGGETSMPDVNFPTETKAIHYFQKASTPVYNSIERKRVNGVLLAPRHNY